VEARKQLPVSWISVQPSSLTRKFSFEYGRSRFLWNNGNEENKWKHCPDNDNQIYGRGNLLRQLLCSFGLRCFKTVYEANILRSKDRICCSRYFLLCTSFVSWPQNFTGCFPCGWHPFYVVVVVTSRSYKLADSASFSSAYEGACRLRWRLD
jgi:hypothetical protein